MKYATLLLEPNPAPGGGGTGTPLASPTPAPAIPTVAPIERTFVPASTALGESGNKAEIDRLIEKNKGNLPKPSVTYEPPKPADPAPEPASAPAAPPVAPEPPKPTTPEPPKKIKVGEKEYSPEELEQIIKGQNQPAQPPAPAPALAPVPNAPKPPTKEEVQKLEHEWVEKQAAQYSGPKLDEAQIETILSGGKEGAAALNNLFAKVYATAVLETRKSIYTDFTPEFDGIKDVLTTFKTHLQPVVQQQHQLERVATEQLFLQQHPDFTPHAERARQVAEALAQQFPKEVAAMTRDQFIAEVAKQTDGILTTEFRRWNSDPNANWRTFGKAATPPPGAVPQGAAPAAPASPPAVPTPPTAPATPPPIAPLGANLPVSVPPVNTTNWHKNVAASLRE